MNLFYIWLAFIIFMGVSESDDSHYFLFCFFMFYVTYLYNVIVPIKLTVQLYVFYLSIPSIILWWIIYTYNWLLSIEEPISNEIMISIIFLYFYMFIYIFWEGKANITQLVRVLGCGSKSHRFESCYSPF